jgi:hypothetical protein
LEEIRDHQSIKSIYGHIDRNIRDYTGTTLHELFPHKDTDEGSTFRASLMNIEAAAQVFLAPRDMDHFNKVLSSSCRKYKVEQVWKVVFELTDE